MTFKLASLALLTALAFGGSPANAQPAPGGMPAQAPHGPPAGGGMGPAQLAQMFTPEASRPAQQTRFTIRVDGVSALQLAWWFEHIADDNGAYWTPLAPKANTRIEWGVNPREDAHSLIGALFISDQTIGRGLFPGDRLRMLLQFQDYVTQNRGIDIGKPMPLNPPLSIPADYVPPYPSPMITPIGGALRPLKPEENGFNQNLIFTDGHGFAPGRILFSWKNAGSDDTAATAGQPRAIDLTVTFYQYWMEGPNRPPPMTADGYYLSPAQTEAVWGVWKEMLLAMPAKLPGWFAADTQDDLARAKGFTIVTSVDTGLVEGVDNEMMVWWWNHAMGDAPGVNYVLWQPSGHFAIRWLPGFSPSEVLGGKPAPTDRVVPGIIYPDLQGGKLIQDGGGMMSYPPQMAPIPGKYKMINPMFVVSKEQVDNFSVERFPAPPAWLLHQWEERDGGVIHRSTSLQRLPLRTPVTQQGFYSEHQFLEGQYWGTQSMRKAYAKWREQQPSQR